MNSKPHPGCDSSSIPDQPFDYWGNFLEARARLINHWVRNGRSYSEITVDLSLKVGQAKRIYEATKNDPSMKESNESPR